ncbi:hypothetical protein EMIT079MI2_150103 [Bacillus sp. IT-79MI2]
MNFIESYSFANTTHHITNMIADKPSTKIHLLSAEGFSLY